MMRKTDALLRNSRGLTLIDLIVLIAASFVLLALVLPVMVRVRSVAQKEACSNNLREQAIAIHNFHDSYKRLPPGMLGFKEAIEDASWDDPKSQNYWRRTQYTSSFAMMMPFVGQSQIYDRVDPSAYNVYRMLDEIERGANVFHELQGYSVAATTEAPFLHCPADDIYLDADLETIVCIQPCIKGNNQNSDGFVEKSDRDLANQWKIGKPIAKTNYLACGGAYSGGFHPDRNRKKYQGGMSSRSRVTLEQIANRSGTTFSIAFGESVGKMKDKKRQRAQAWFTAAFGRMRGDKPFSTGNSTSQGNLLGDTFASSEYGFGSMHDQGVNFAMFDSSTRCFKRNTDHRVLYALASIHTDDGLSIEKLRKFETRVADTTLDRPVMDDPGSDDENSFPILLLLVVMLGLGVFVGVVALVVKFAFF